MNCKLGLIPKPNNNNTGDDCCDELRAELELLADAKPYTTFLNSYNS